MTDATDTPKTQDTEEKQPLDESVELDAELLETEEPVGEAPKAQNTSNKALEEKYNALHDQYVRLAADFENYRKRQGQEQANLKKYGSERAIEEILPVLDNLERARQSLDENSDGKTLYQSFELMTSELCSAMERIGVKKLETVGQEFDPNFHEAIGQLETSDYPDNTVAAEMQSGYLLHDRLIRPAMVQVAVNPSGAAPAKNEEKQENPAKDSGEASTKGDNPFLGPPGAAQSASEQEES